MKGTVAPLSSRSMAAWTCHSCAFNSPAICCEIDAIACPRWGGVSSQRPSPGQTHEGRLGPLSCCCDTGSGRRTRRGFLCGREAGRLVRHEARRRAMARVADHLSVDDLEARLRSAQDPTAARHFQVIWLLARGHTIADVAAVTSFVPRWIEQLLARYNAHGPEALGDLRRRNGSAPRVLRPALLERLRTRLTQPPPDGGLWTGPKVAR